MNKVRIRVPCSFCEGEVYPVVGEAAFYASEHFPSLLEYPILKPG